MKRISAALAFFLLLASPEAMASETAKAVTMGISPFHWAGLFCIAVFLLSYTAVLFEEAIDLRKSKPVMLGTGIIWITIGFIAPSYNIDHHTLHEAVFHGLHEFGSLLLFLLAAMTYISALQDRQVFAVLRAKLVRSGLNLRQLFWVTGTLAFILSPIADNLTTALVLGAVIMAVGAQNKKFIALACVNVVCAANAGGAFSPFGDITTLMVWQAGKVDFFEFFALFLPSVACFLVPAAIMSVFVPRSMPAKLEEKISLKRGARLIIFLGLFTIALAVCFEQVLGLPPFLGMMVGLSLLMMVAYVLRTTKPKDRDFDVLELVASAEWDTLLFFFGVIFSIGGLSFLGYMELASQTMYLGWGASAANIVLGLVSAVIDNIPVMFAVLTMDPDMPHFQWLLITLTTGVGGSLFSIGSAAGVALMGTARGYYTFSSHLKWTPVIMLGYAAAIGAHFLLNSHL
ncbi:MAG: sodium:proton antiporter [Alphaproteobacteria bacterium]|nr:sodium:proton antiporter [Alphaproteobacteria bacterium]